MVSRGYSGSTMTDISVMMNENKIECQSHRHVQSQLDKQRSTWKGSRVKVEYVVIHLDLIKAVMTVDAFLGRQSLKKEKKTLQINTAISTAPEIKTFLD